jgi:hypothetical protein
MITALAAPARILSCVLLVVLAAGCVTQSEKRSAIEAVNQAFQADYESLLAKQGTRTFKVTRGEAFVATHAALSRLGMRIENQDPDVGYLNVNAPAPSPLGVQEWRQCSEADLPRLRAIARPHIGLLAEFVSFEPEGLQIVINATVLETGSESEISLTTRMREVAPPSSGMPRREYPPPTCVGIALDKIWRQVEGELRAAKRIP